MPCGGDARNLYEQRCLVHSPLPVPQTGKSGCTVSGEGQATVKYAMSSSATQWSEVVRMLEGRRRLAVGTRCG